jgi:SIR2-like domain
MPLGSELAEWIRTHDLSTGIDFALLGAALDDPAAVMQLADACQGARRDERRVALRDMFEQLCETARLTESLLSLARVPGRLILTLNYDDLVERAAEEQNLTVRSLAREDIPELIPALPQQNDPLHVVHLHGSVRSGEPFVLDPASYAKVMADTDVLGLFTAIIGQQRGFCLLGTPLNESHLRALLRRYRGSSPRHVILCEERMAELVLANDARAPVRLIDGIIPCSYPNDRHEVVAAFCASLVSADHAASDIGRQASTAELPRDPLYVPRRLLPLTDSENQEVALMLGHIREIREGDLSLEARALIVDGPGTGKTELLRSLAMHPMPGEHPAYVRLRNVRMLTGTPEALLSGWLAAADAAFGTVEPEAVITGTRGLHLLLDGLDEQPPSTRDAAAAAIARVAAAFPSVRFTVTSRPSSALDAFTHPWNRFSLVFDTEWTEAFFKALNEAPDDFRKRLGLHEKTLSPLLEIPFFLRRLATLGDTELATAVPTHDALDLILWLLERAIEEDPNLAGVADAVQWWLTDVALQMQLEGERSQPLSSFVPFTARLDLGDTALLTDQLAGRSLLEEQTHAWSFAHRLFADALIAQKLLGEPPDRWLDVIAPVAHGRSAVREDWASVVRLLGGKSERWRTAVATRDPVTAARATPHDAPVTERRAALHTLWNRAHDLQIWIDRDGQGPSDDAAAIATWLQQGGLEDEVIHFIHELTAGSRYDRANALDVLVHADPSKCIRHIETVLTTDADSTVRRSAASWAGRLDAKQLAETVLARAERPEDDAEAMDMASIGLRLTDAPRRLEVARRLLVAGNEHIHERQIFEETPPTIDRIRWIRDRLEADPDETIHHTEHDLLELINQLTSISDEDAQVIGETLALVGARSTKAVEWLLDHPAATDGLVSVLARGRAHAYQVHPLLMAVGSRRLEAAGCDRDTLSWVRRWEQPRHRPADPEPMEKVEPDLTPPRIEQVLDLPADERCHELAARSHSLVPEASNASPALLARLREALEELWAGDLHDGIALTESGARLNYWASVVLSYGPAVELSLAPDRWVEVATCGWLFSEQLKWLAQQADQRRFDAAADVCAPEARFLTALLRVASLADLRPDRVVIRLGEMSTPSTDRGRDLFAALAEAQQPDAVRQLSATHPHLAPDAEPHLASAGDVMAQRTLIRGLIDRFQRGETVDRHDAQWLEAVQDASLIPLLAEALVVSHARSGRELHPFDAAQGVLAAIEHIGGLTALEALDRIVTDRPWPGAQWLFGHRDNVLQRELTEAARSAIREKLSELHANPDRKL